MLERYLYRIYMYIYTFLGISICILYTIQSIYRGFLKWGYPKMYGLWWKNRSVHGWFKGTPISGNFNICTCIYIWLTDVYIHNMYLHNIYTCMCFLLFNGYISVKGSLNLEKQPFECCSPKPAVQMWEHDLGVFCSSYCRYVTMP